MKEVHLFTRAGKLFATALVQPMETLPEVVLLGARVFVGGHDGIYREAVSRQVFSREEYESMIRDGITI